MIRLVKLHLGLIKYLKIELKKNKNKKEWFSFIKNLTISYITELLRLYKDLFLIFDADFRKQKKYYKKYNQLKKELNQALKILQYIDAKMEKQGLSRQKRRQFWQDFYKNGSVRKEMFDDLLKEVGG